MNWDAIAALAEITASVGVIVSLIYVGIQIRNQTVESQLDSGDELTQQLINTYQMVASEREVAEILTRGLFDLEPLDNVDTMRFGAYANCIVRTTESMFYRKRAGRLSSNVWVGLETAMADVFRYPGMQSWWFSRTHWFSDDFVDYMSSNMISDEKPRMYEDQSAGRSSNHPHL